MLQLFVPGRLCLMGEHSDWAGLHRIMNAKITPGQAIVTGIEQGIYATVSRSDKFIFESDLPLYSEESFVCEMDTEELLKTANEGGFFSYVAGVASYINENYNVKGIHVKITKMDLPMKSGLSSSAAICVLVARAFNKLYNLKLNVRGEMYIAYMGEQRTPSRCGRLDQACAYGVKPVSMVFDGNEIKVKEINMKKDMHLVVADLNASKDTIKILGDLNKCYPFADNEISGKVHEALGKDNQRFVADAIEAMEAGDLPLLGNIMKEFQQNFDEKVMPACPKELTAPVLHSVINDENLQLYIYGAKGVGSQGDGTVQFLAKDKESQLALIEYLKTERGMSAFPLTLKATQSVRKAIIPVAGFGTRLFPASKGIKKEFLPVLDSDGLFKPAILTLLEQLVVSGIEEIALVIGEEEQYLYDNLFQPMSEENYQKLPPEKQQYEDFIRSVGEKITYIYQKERKGFGHAVYQCRKFTEDEPVLLLLGDMIYKSNTMETCSRQLINAFDKCKKPVVSIHAIPVEDVVHYGVIAGKWQDEEQRLMEIHSVVEKPTVEYASANLVTERNGQGNCYCVFGQYILTKEVFEQLKYNIDNNVVSRGEIQLTDALDAVREKYGMMAYMPDGTSFDVGLPQEYIKTVNEY